MKKELENIFSKIEAKDFTITEFVTEWYTKKEVDAIIDKINSVGMTFEKKGINGYDNFVDCIKKPDYFNAYRYYRVFYREFHNIEPSLSKRCSKDLISFIIPNRGENRLDKVTENIKEIYGKFNYEIIVVEQDDNDIFKKGQLYNEAFKKCSGKYIALLDNDIMSERFINLIATYKKINKPYLAFGTIKQIVYTNDSEYEVKSENRNSESYGQFLFCSRSDFEKANGFSNLFFGWGMEDTVMDIRFEKIYSLNNSLLHITHPRRINKNVENTNINGDAYRNYLNDIVDCNYDGYKQTTAETSYITEEDGVKYIGIKNIGVIDGFKYQSVIDMHKQAIENAEKEIKLTEKVGIDYSLAEEDNEHKVVVLVESSKEHIQIEKLIRNSWAKEFGDNVSTIFYRCGYSEFRYDIENKVFELPIGEEYESKYLSALYAISASKGLFPDYVLMTNIHCYLNAHLIKKLISTIDIDSDEIYTDEVFWDKQISYANNDFMLFSGKVLNELADNNKVVYDMDAGYGISRNLYDLRTNRLEVAERAYKIKCGKKFEDFYTDKTGNMFINCRCGSDTEEIMKQEIVGSILDNSKEQLSAPEKFEVMRFEDKGYLNIDDLRNVIKNAR